MFRPFKKLIVLLLAVWFPLFSGNALAVAVIMHAQDYCKPVAMQHEGGHAMHSQHAGQDPCAGHEAPQSAPCENCGVCHFACSGYLAAQSAQTTVVHAVRQPFVPLAAQFRSTILTPPVPPPFARA